MRQSPNLLLNFILGFLVLISSPVLADCTTPDKCEHLWVAAQDTGIALSFFGKVDPPRDAAKIQIGDTLVSEHNVNVRTQPSTKNNDPIGRLPIGTQVEVEDMRRITVPGEGTQIWLRITTTPGSIEDKNNGQKGTKNKKIDPPNPNATDDIQIHLDQSAKKIVSCYIAQSKNQKNTTIRNVYECSGFWVIPRALMACSLGARCPALSDSPNGRALLAVALKQDGLNLDSELKLLPTQMPRMPITKIIENCNQNSGMSQADFLECTTRPMLDVHKAQVDCFKLFTDGEKLECFAKQVNNKDFTALIGCLAGGPPSPDKLAVCTSKPELEKKVAELRRCVAGASNEQNARSCISNQLATEHQVILDCLSRPKATDFSPCLDTFSPDMKKARLIKTCMEDNANQADVAQCIVTKVGGDGANVVKCLKSKEYVGTALCLLGDTPQSRVVKRVYGCIAGGRDVSSVILSCSDDVIPDIKTRQTIACVAKASGERAKLASCSAAVVLPEEAARIVGCASDSSGPTSFALCAAGPAMNEEWRIAAECATQSAGNPATFAGCTAGRLTVRELTKCLTGTVGKDCFGPNNTIVLALNNSYKDLTQGPGPNNDIIKALEDFKKLSGGPNSVINNPDQIFGGPNSVFHNPGQILGGPGSVFHDPGQVLDPSRWRW